MFLEVKFSIYLNRRVFVMLLQFLIISSCTDLIKPRLLFHIIYLAFFLLDFVLCKRHRFRLFSMVLFSVVLFDRN